MREQLVGNDKIPSSNVLQERTTEHLRWRSRRSVGLTPSNTRKYQLLMCKLQHYNLAIMDDGTVIGLKNQTSPSGMSIMQHVQRIKRLLGWLTREYQHSLFLLGRIKME